jgi:hypothetical protein
MHSSRWQLFGSSSSHVIRISGTALELQFESLTLGASNPVMIRGSNVNISLSGINTLAGSVLCEGNSSIAFTGASDAVLDVRVPVGSSEPGIGTTGTCGTLRFAGGNYVVETAGGAAIGSAGGGTHIERIELDSCLVRANVTGGGAVIGTGATLSGSASIGTITVSGSTISAMSGDGALVGTGISRGTSTQFVETIAVRDSSIDDLRSSSDVYFALGELHAQVTGIGCGEAFGGSTQRVNEIICANLRLKNVLVGVGGTNGTARAFAGPIEVRDTTFVLTTRLLGVGCWAGFGESHVEMQLITVSGCDFTFNASGGGCIGGFSFDNRALVVGDVRVSDTVFTQGKCATSLTLCVGFQSFQGSVRGQIGSIDCHNCTFTAGGDDDFRLRGVVGINDQGGQSVVVVTRIAVTGSWFNAMVREFGVGSCVLGNSAVQNVSEIAVVDCHGAIAVEMGMGSAIGCAGARAGDCRVLCDRILVEDCDLRLYTWIGPAIGLGGSMADTGQPRQDQNVTEILVRGSTLDIRSIVGAGIGSGYASGRAQLVIQRVTVRNCTGSIVTFGGAGIGLGHCDGIAVQALDYLEVEGCSFRIVSGGGSCIGGGAGELLPDKDEVFVCLKHVIVRDCPSLELRSETGAGIGLGDERLPAMTAAAGETRGSTEVENIAVENSTINASVGTGACIGTGHTLLAAKILGIVVRDCVLGFVISGGAAGVGSGVVAREGYARVGSIVVERSIIRAKGCEGALFGGGLLIGNVKGSFGEIHVRDCTVEWWAWAPMVGLGSASGPGSSAEVDLIELDGVVSRPLTVQRSSIVGIAPVGSMSSSTVEKVVIKGSTLIGSALTSDNDLVAGVGVGSMDGGSAAIGQVVVETSELDFRFVRGAGIGTTVRENVAIGGICVVNTSGSIIVENVGGVQNGVAIGGATNISITGSRMSLKGDLAIGTPHMPDARVELNGPLNIKCDSLNVTNPCIIAGGGVKLAGGNMRFYVTGRKFATNGSMWGTQLDPGVPVSIFYTVRAATEDQVMGQTATFIVGEIAEGGGRRVNIIVRVSDSDIGWLVEHDSGEFPGFALTISDPPIIPGHFNVTYREEGEEGKTGTYSYSNGAVNSRYITPLELPSLMAMERADMIDDISGPPDRIAPAIVVVIVVSVVTLLFLVAAVVLNCLDFDLSDRVEREASSEAEESPAVSEVDLTEPSAVSGSSKVKRIGWRVLRCMLMVLGFIFSFLGFMTFFYVAVLVVVSFVMAVFTNAICGQWLGMVVQVLMLFYMLPVLELLISLVIVVVKRFFRQYRTFLSLEGIRRAFQRQLEPPTPGDKVVVVYRLAWCGFYFFVMTFLFLVVLIGGFSSSDGRVAELANGLQFTFAVFCTIVPLVTLFRPVLLSWYVLSCDRPQPLEEEMVQGQDKPERTWIERVTRDSGLRLYDLPGLLQGDSWESYLRSDITLGTRPQCANCWSTALPLIGFILLLVILLLVDVYRVAFLSQAQVYDATSDTWEAIGNVSQQLGAARPERNEWPFWEDMMAWFWRALLLIFTLPFVVLSSQWRLFTHWKQLKKHEDVRLAKIIGVGLLGVALIFFFVGLALYYTFPDTEANDLHVEPVNVTRTFSVEDQPALCRALEGWNMTQLVALPALVEAKSRNRTDLMEYVSFLADIPQQEEPLLTINSVLNGHASFHPRTNRLVVGMAPLGATANYAIFLETSLPFWYQKIFGALIPFYSLVWDFFLSNICRSASEFSISVVLGPCRQTVFGLRRAKGTANQALLLTYSVMTGWRKAARGERPTIVGHGANGVLAKAIDFNYEPWRLTLEAPAFDESPLVAMSDYAKTSINQATTRVVNLFTGSVYTRSDKTASSNIEMPKHGVFPARPPDVWETLCFIAAACDSDDGFHTLCGEILGDEKAFYAVHNKLGRTGRSVNVTASSGLKVVSLDVAKWQMTQ